MGNEDAGRLLRMIDYCERKAREPVENLVNYPNNSFNNEAMARAANFAVLAEEYRRQLDGIFKPRNR